MQRRTLQNGAAPPAAALQRLLRLFRAGAPARGPATRELLAPAEFERQLRRERARSQRAGSEFVAIRLRCVEVPKDARRRRLVTSLLAEVASERLRETDVLGWWTDQEELGLILPSTSARGAVQLVEALERLLHERSLRGDGTEALRAELDCQVFPYSAAHPPPDSRGGG
mgnify:CR=1 FL=1